jgi:hypothetical protein
MIAPLKTKLVGVEVTEPGDGQVERFSLARGPLERKILSGVARMLS